MKTLLRLLLLLLVVAAAPLARAAITCTTITSPTNTIAYASGGTATQQTYFTVTCSRGLTTDATSVSYSVKADNGLNASGQNNNASLGASTLRYDVYTNSTCATQWKGNTAISDSMTWSSATTGSQSKNTSFWICITTAQTPTASGTYTDSVGMTMTYGTSTLTGSVPVSIVAPANCTVSTPSNVTLNYTAFQTTAPSTTTSFTATCTNGLPYTVAMDVTENVLVGIRYSLAVSNASSSGTGSAVSHTVTVSANAGQAGTCTTATCSGSRTHTITITY